MKRALTALTALAMLLALLSGCGGGAQEAAPQEAPAPAEETAEAVVEEIAEAPETTPAEEPAGEASGEMNDGASGEPASSEEPEETMDLGIGLTGFYITVPADYVPGEVTNEELADDMIAYYYSDIRLMDFDIYEFPTEGQSLEEYAALEAEEYGAEGFELLDINGTPVALYYSGEEYAGEAYKVANYLFAADDEFGEIAFWLDGEDAEALVEQIISTLTRTQGPDYVSATVIEKTSDSSFPDLYLVRTEDGEELECEYIGMDELQPGQEVEIYAWGPEDWMIELTDSWADWEPEPAETPAPDYVTENGITVSELKVRRAGTIWNFGYYLYNPADETQYFDPSGFVLKAADGTEITTAAKYVSEDEVWADNITTVSLGILDQDAISPGDEISVYYNGTLLGTVTATES